MKKVCGNFAREEMLSTRTIILSEAVIMFLFLVCKNTLVQSIPLKVYGSDEVWVGGSRCKMQICIAEVVVVL